MATIYIDPTYGTGGDGSFATPYDSYADLGSLSAGDIVLQKEKTVFRGGYTVGQSGSSGSPILFGTYDADTGDRITTFSGANSLRHAVVDGGASVANCFLADTKDYITISGIKVQGATSHSIRFQGSSGAQGCTNCIVEWCTNGDGALACISFNNTVKCIARYNTIIPRANGLWAIALSSGGAFSPSYNLIHNNTLSTRFGTDLGAAGVIVSASGDTGLIGVDIIDNKIVNYGRSGIRITGWKSGYRISGNICNNSLATSVQDEGAGIHVAGFSATGKFSRGLVTNNTLIGDGEFGIYTTFTDGLEITNNTVILPGQKTSRKYGRGIEIYGATGGDVNGVRVINNSVSYSKNSGLLSAAYSEGVGIGVDNNARHTVVRGNHVFNNEGQGIQINTTSASYPTWIIGNILVNNGTNAGVSINRANGGIAESSGLVTWAHNVHVSSTYGLWEMTSAGANNVIRNNIFIDASLAGLVYDSGKTETNNCFYNNTTNIATSTSDTTPTFTPTTAHASDIEENPLLNVDYSLKTGSPCLGAGYRIVPPVMTYNNVAADKATTDIGAKQGIAA